MKMSRIWKDILRLKSNNFSLFKTFKDNIRIVIGNGKRISFWNDVWVGNATLKEVFPRLELIAVNKDGRVAEFVDHLVGPNVCWNIQFRRKLLAWEEELSKELMNLVNSMKIDSNGEMDRMIWIPESDKGFSVKYLYRQIESTWVQRDHVVDLVWKNAAPLKVKFLGWLVWAGRLKTTEWGD